MRVTPIPAAGIGVCPGANAGSWLEGRSQDGNARVTVVTSTTRARGKAQTAEPEVHVINAPEARPRHFRISRDGSCFDLVFHVCVTGCGHHS